MFQETFQMLQTIIRRAKQFASRNDEIDYPPCRYFALKEKRHPDSNWG